LDSYEDNIILLLNYRKRYDLLGELRSI